jgi:putative ABC transport system permease protein
LYSPYRQRGEEFKHAGTTFEEGQVLGVGAALPEIRDVTLVEGRFFTEQEQRTRQYVAVIGEDVRALLYPNATAVGKQLKIRGLDFEVIGVQEKLGSAFGRSQDNSVYIPYTVFARLYGTGQSVSVFGRPRPGLTLEEALDISRVSLRTRFRARPGQPDRFDTVTPDAIRSFIDNMLKMISAVVVPVTGISLVVGGIVIMNIMLVSVTERTHEIGVRKSLGARRADILLQFLIEAVLLSAAGGAMGLLVGVALTELLSRVFEISMKVTAVYVVLSLVVSSVVGIFSGWYPAARASKLDPVAALRAE